MLGPLAISGDGDSIAPRDRVVLAALTVRRGEVVGAAVLADALWREHPPATWSKQIQASVVRLRRALGAGAIETDGDGYRLVLASDEIDAHRFERLVTSAGSSTRSGRRTGPRISWARRWPCGVERRWPSWTAGRRA